eukprot:14612578-Alexandrium_andersonii.AAC.1
MAYVTVDVLQPGSWGLPKKCGGCDHYYLCEAWVGFGGRCLCGDRQDVLGIRCTAACMRGAVLARVCERN